MKKYTIISMRIFSPNVNQKFCLFHRIPIGNPECKGLFLFVLPVYHPYLFTTIAYTVLRAACLPDAAGFSSRFTR